jgi:hypothetical protein
MPTNSYLPFAIAAGANVWSDATYNGAQQQQSGQQKGIVPSGMMNKVWRQGSVGTSALGQIIVDHGLVDAADDGNLAGFKANLRMAFAAMLAGAAFGVDQSTSANLLIITLDPAPPSLSTYRGVFIRVANTNTGAVSLTLNNLGTKTVVKRNGQPLVAGDLVQGQFIHLIYDLSIAQWVVAGAVVSETKQQLIAGGKTTTFSGAVTGNLANRALTVITFTDPSTSDFTNGNTSGIIVGSTGAGRYIISLRFNTTTVANGGTYPQPADSVGFILINNAIKGVDKSLITITSNGSWSNSNSVISDPVVLNPGDVVLPCGQVDADSYNGATVSNQTLTLTKLF